MEDLPWSDGSFDVVTGFNSFFIAADAIRALGEAKRVARPGGKVAMTVFGRPERCGSTAPFAALRQFAPPGAKPSGPGDEQPLEARAAAAGLTPQTGGCFAYAEEYPDEETMLRGYLAAPPFVRAARVAGEDAVREALAERIRPLRTPAGTYRLEDEVEFLVTSA